jgi:hypothetical protein
MDVTFWTGVLGIGGIAGIAALGFQSYDLWSRRVPNLKLFVPYNFKGTHSESKDRFIFALVRISNSSYREAFIYLETLRAEVLFKKRWYQMSVPSFPANHGAQFDLPEEVQHYAGVKYISFFNKFDSPVISLDKPYSRYIGLYCSNPNIVEGAEKLKLEFKDCNLRRYTLIADIVNNDPEYLT